MSVTNKSTALSNFNPVYNPLVYMFNSNNKNKPGFRYVVDIYSGATSTKIYEGRVVPRPTDGYGYIDVSKIVSDYVTYDVDLTGTTNIHADDSYFGYTVKIGEEFQEAWEFADTTSISGSVTLLSGAASNTFVAGDQVIINLDTPSYFPGLEGLQTVYTAVTSNSFIVNIGFVSSPVNPGTASYADGRKSIYRDLLTYSSQVAFNAAFSSSDWISYDKANYQLNGASTTKEFLTNIPDNFYCSLTQDLFVNAAYPSSSDAIQIKFQNDGGDLFYKTAGAIEDIMQYAVGPNNYGTLTALATGTTLIESTTTYYDFWVKNDSGQQISEKIRVWLDRKCGIEDYEILFLDRKGSFASFSFPLRAETKQKGKRTSFNQQIGYLSGGKWTYSNSDNGMVTSDLSVSEELTLRTGYITPEMAIYFSELIFSPVTYVKIDGTYYSCEVKTNNYNPQSPRLRKLNKQEVTITLSNQNNVNI